MPESPKERTDRQLIELLNELRVALPGAQVLLAFLLTVPFQTHFDRTSDLQRAVLYAGVILTAVGVVLLMAPSVYHRIRWEEGGKADVVLVGHRFFLTGTACLALGLFCAVFLVGDFVYGTTAGVVALVAIVAVAGFTWYALPLSRSRDPDVRESE